MGPILIHRPVVEAMLEHARRELPLECCGLLYGRGKTIEGIRPTANEKGSETEFFVPLPELFAFFRELRERHLRHLGVYHSHPQGTAQPSERDLEEFHYPEVSYWIVAPAPGRPSIRCFRKTGNRFQEIQFRVVPAAH